MKPSPHDFEKKVLQDLLRQMEDPEDAARKLGGLRGVFLGMGSGALTLAFFMAINDQVHPFISALLAAGSGCLIGFGAFLNTSQKQWPVTRPHIDMDSVRQRLEEIEG